MERPSLPSLLISIAILMAASKIFSLTPVPFSSSLTSDSFFSFFSQVEQSLDSTTRLLAYFFFQPVATRLFIITDKAPDDTYSLSHLRVSEASLNFLTALKVKFPRQACNRPFPGQFLPSLQLCRPSSRRTFLPIVNHFSNPFVSFLMIRHSNNIRINGYKTTKNQDLCLNESVRKLKYSTTKFTL